MYDTECQPLKQEAVGRRPQARMMEHQTIWHRTGLTLVLQRSVKC